MSEGIHQYKLSEIAAVARIVETYFTIGDISQLLMELGIDLQNVCGPNEPKPVVVREALMYANRRLMAQELLSLMARDREALGPRLAPYLE